MIAFCSSMDQAGPFSKDAFGCAALLDAMASYEKKTQRALKEII